MALTVTINGEAREFSQMDPGASLSDLVAALELKQDRVALELNGQIAPRKLWAELLLDEADKIELVHFVGGGTSSE